MRNALPCTLMLLLLGSTCPVLAEETAVPENAQPSSPQAASAGQDEDAEPEATGLEAALELVDEALGDRNPVALIRPEGSGAMMNLMGLELWWQQALQRRADRVLLEPDRVLRLAGLEFAISPVGIGGVAKRCGTEAALFLRIFFVEDRYELHIMLADEEGVALLDRVVAIPELPHSPGLDEQGQPGKVLTPLDDDRLMQPATRTVAAPTRAAQPPEVDPQERFANLSVSFVPGPGQTWGVRQGKAGRISELTLAEMAGDPGAQNRVKEEIGALRFKRNLGIGLTLAGGVVAGLSTPLLKEQDGALAAGGVTMGLGLATAAAGAVLWALFGPEAEAADSPYPRQHVLSREEARRLVQLSNDSLRRQLGLDSKNE